MNHLGEIISLIVAVSWTFSAWFADKASRRIGSMETNVIRLVLATVFLSLLLWVTIGSPYPVHADGKAWLWLGLSALVGYVFGDYCLFNSYLVIGPRLGQLMMTIAPPMAAIAGWIMLGESMSWKSIVAMLVTLCGLQLYTGLAYGITGGPAINGMCDAFQAISNGSIAGIPYVLFIFIAVFLLVTFVMKSTVFGHEIYFLGSNARASRYSGINTLKVTIMTHAFSGILGGISGILITSHLNSAKSSNGSTYTLLTLLIVVLGGVHPDGGKGKVLGVTLSTILLQLIANAFGLLHMDDNAKTFVNGCMLVAALLLDVYLDKRAAKRN